MANKEERKSEVYELALRMFLAKTPVPGSGEVGRLIIESRRFTANPEYKNGKLVEWHRTFETLSAHDVMVQVWQASEYLYGERV